jgi:conjugative transfer signal peptidase TraF
MMAAKRDYLPASVPALKRIAAMAGQCVCATNGQLEIDGKPAAATLAHDAAARPLTHWRGCRHLVTGELFLLNADSPASFDSRYFGPVDESFVRARAVPLWTW